MAERNRDWIWGAIALVVLVVVVLILAPPPTQFAADQRLSTLRTTPDGAGALYSTLEELDIPVDRRLTPLAGVDPIRGPLAILEPTQDLSPTELDSLFAWVGRGGRLIVAGPYGELRTRLGLAFHYTRSELALEPVPGHPWTAGLQPTDPEEDRIAGRVPGFWVVDPDTLRGGELRALVVEADSGRAVVGVLGHGDGEVLVLTQAGLLANRAIRESRVAPLVVRAAADWTAGRDPLRFDEYHHGHRGGSAYRGLGSFLGSEGIGRMALQLGLVALLALVPAAVRFGAAVSPDPAPRRSRLEHVSALGEVYRQAGAEEVARRRLLAGFARRIGRDRPSPGDEETFLDRLQRSVPAGADAVAAVAAAWRDGRPVAELARQIDGAVARLNPGRTTKHEEPRTATMAPDLHR